MKVTGRIQRISDLDVFPNGKHKQSIIISTFEIKSREFEIHFYDENINI